MPGELGAAMLPSHSISLHSIPFPRTHVKDVGELAQCPITFHFITSHSTPFRSHARARERCRETGTMFPSHSILFHSIPFPRTHVEDVGELAHERHRRTAERGRLRATRPPAASTTPQQRAARCGESGASRGGKGGIRGARFARDAGRGFVGGRSSKSFFRAYGEEKKSRSDRGAIDVPGSVTRRRPPRRANAKTDTVLTCRATIERNRQDPSNDI